MRSVGSFWSYLCRAWCFCRGNQWDNGLESEYCLLLYGVSTQYKLVTQRRKTGLIILNSIRTPSKAAGLLENVASHRESWILQVVPYFQGVPAKYCFSFSWENVEAFSEHSNNIIKYKYLNLDKPDNIRSPLICPKFLFKKKISVDLIPGWVLGKQQVVIEWVKKWMSESNKK